MTKNILIAGAGTMGTYYARNLVEMRDKLNISDITCVDIDYQKCQAFNLHDLDVPALHIDNVPGTLSNIVKSHGINGFIGATQTDSHISVLKEALSVGQNGQPQIQHILQEKPFGLFDDGSQDDMRHIVDTVQNNDIRFGMDSILMFSDAYKSFASFLSANQNLKHIETTCIYGKNRTKDTRPAHMGVFGTEGTHAIDIARRLGNDYEALTFEDGEIIQGYITENDPDVPYACLAQFKTAAGTPIKIQMSLAFDQNYRQVTHLFKNEAGETIDVTLQFDQKNENGVSQDTFRAWNVDSRERPEFFASLSNVKLKNALRSVFSDNGAPYGMAQTLGLREMIAAIRDNAKTQKVSGKPEIRTPRPF